MIIIQYVFLALVVASIAVYFFSRRKWIGPVRAMLIVFCGLVYANLTVDYKLHPMIMLISILLLASIAAGDSLKKSENPVKAYLSFGIASSIFVLPIVVITTVRNDFQFQPDSVWLGMIPIVSLCVWLLMKAIEKERRVIFFITGVLLTATFVAVLFFHPYMYMKTFQIRFLPISIRLNGVYFVYLLMFTVAGFHRVGLLPATFNHAKLTVPIVILGILSYGTRLPDVAKLLAASPITVPLPMILAVLLILLTPAMVAYVFLTSWFPGKNRGTE